MPFLPSNQFKTNQCKNTYVRSVKIAKKAIFIENICIQLDWPPETDTLEINLPRDQEGYDGFEYTKEKLSTRRIHWYRGSSSIFSFGGVFEEYLPK